jgi:hypothetical protein
MLGDFQERLLNRLQAIEKAIEKLKTREAGGGGTSVAATIENVSNPGGNIDIVGVNGIVATGDNTAKTITIDGAALATDADLAAHIAANNPHPGTVARQTGVGATIYEAGRLGLTDSGNPAINVQAGAAQSLPVAQFVDSSAAEFASINPTSGGSKGIFYAAQSAARNAFEAVLTNASAKGLFIKAWFAHSANLIEVQQATGGTIFKVDANGNTTTPVLNVTGGGAGINLPTGTSINFGSGATIAQPSGGLLDVSGATLRAPALTATTGAVTAGTDITATAGNISATAGYLNAGAHVRVANIRRLEYGNTSFPASPIDLQQFYRTDWRCWFEYVNADSAWRQITVPHYSGGFPAAPAAGLKVWRQDLNREFTYRTDAFIAAGSKWCTVERVFCRPIVSGNPTPQGNNVLLADIVLPSGCTRATLEKIDWTFVATSAAQSAGNRYNFTASLRTSAGGNATITLGGAANTSGAIAPLARYFRGTATATAADNSVNDGGLSMIEIVMTAVGTPGTYYVSATATVVFSTN